MARQLAIRPETIDIRVPLISPDEEITNPIRVTIESPKQYRKAVFKIARFFQKEFGYDFVQYGYNGEDNYIKHVAFLWILPDAIDFALDFRIPCIGATCFRWREWQNHEPCWGLQWIWFHPYIRRKGLLTKAWPSFKEEFGDFICETPLSEAMRKFLTKMDSNLE